MMCVVPTTTPVLSHLLLGMQWRVVWRSLAILVKHGPVEMGISTVVKMVADTNLSFTPVRMALLLGLLSHLSAHVPCTLAL